MSDEQDLRDRLRDGQVLFIAGAGVSIATVAGQAIDGEPVASWTGLLRHGVARVEGGGTKDETWGGLRRGQIQTGEIAEMVTAAELITEAMGGRDSGEYAQWLGATVGKLTPREPSTIEALHGLGAPIATTNYDNLIEAVTGNQDRLTWMDGSQWQSVLRGDRRAVLHLHGHCYTPRSVILGLRSYGDILADQNAQAMLDAIALTRTLVLVGVGAGLDDPNFGALRAWLGALSPMYPHYRLVHRGELSREEIAGDRKDRIVPVEYGDGHGDLEPFLRSVAPSRRGGTGGAKKQRVLELKISRRKVVATATPRGVTAEGDLELDPLRVSMVRMLEDWLRRREEVETGGKGGATEMQEAQLLGRILYDSVLHGTVKTLYDEELAAVQRPDRLALVLKLEREGVASIEADPAVSLTDLPWELLYGPTESWLARDGRLTLFRALPRSGPATAADPEALRILIVRAQPADVLAATRGRWSDEKAASYDAALEEIVGHLTSLKGNHRAVGDVTLLETPGLGAVDKALLAQTRPNIVHYIGYDSFNMASRKRCVALLQAGSGQAVWADSQQFADEFSSFPPKLVFLHLCEGPRDGYTEPSYDFARASFTELARLLLDRGVQLVVAMQYPMSPDIGAKFTRQFYDSVGAGESVAEAVQAARQQAAMFYRLGAPVLYLHSADEALVMREEERRPVEGRAGGQRVVSNRKEDVITYPEAGPAELHEPPAGGGPVIHGGAGAPAIAPGISRADFRMLGEVVAQQAGYSAFGVTTFRRQAEELWDGLGADPVSRLEESALADAARERVDTNPNSDLAMLWTRLSEQLEPERRASVRQ